ncbi:peptidyl-prolyl cis-trans isomerase [Hyphomonas pacifica]|uniref:Parvulin-like PPIase n=1 Tax=Hyphomonas pacifica TaxID=1280941 RepID=A0A062TWI3_9PROT|nr:peptidylprolyl isomerase [Hyphomonas pacifica]KCZ52396.1 hypothetical protein HY2_08250 [Hyphomonas pacifica]RAN35169.1 hypothetical protein HY3_08855 [Hyphomonas pacifica]
MRYLREPLIQFVVAAALVFAVHTAWKSWQDKSDSTIFVSETELERLAALYASEASALPGPEDMMTMVSDYVRDEALAREARRLGLDQGDTIITRRLAQKMSFMVSDLREDPVPSEEALREWHQAYADRFTKPARITFSHIFFSPSVRGDIAEKDAAVLLANLNSAPATDTASLGDPFMLQRQYGDVPLRELARQFGVEFADAIAELPASDDWQGPVRSALGVHLVHVTHKTDVALPPFDEARAEVRQDWVEQKRREANEKAIADIIARYNVEIEGVE